VNRTIIFADRRGAVNPGIPPAFIASASGRPFHASHIAPIVLAGTLGVAGAIILRNNFHDRSRTRISVRESDRIYQPGERFQRLPGLNKGERGRFEGNTPRAAQGRNAVLNLGAPAGSQNRQFHRRTNAPQPQTQTDQKQLAPKQFEQKNQPKSFEQKSVPQRNLPQNTQQPKTFQQKTDERRPTSGNDRKRFEDTKRNSEQKGIQQRNLQQKSFQQNNQIQRSPGSNNPPSRLPVQQHSQPQRNLQQNPRPNVQQQRIQQPPRPAPQQAPHPQNSNKNQEKKSQ
jgi:hypothetical protein